jgi:DNA-binding NarL/FixJ family response regulator
MLLQGLAESAIAETLSVSRRTVQRSVKGMMSRAGAANRVQLGWHAQRSGWI